MGWGQESQTPKGLDGAPPKGELATWGRNPMSTAHCPAGRVTWTGARVQSPSTRTSTTEKQWGKDVVARLRLPAFDRTARHPRPRPRPKRDRRFTVHAWEKRLARAVSHQASDAPTARQTVAETRFPIGPLFLPRLRHGKLPTVCCRLHAHGAGVVLREPVMEKPFRPLLRYRSGLAYLSISQHAI